MQVEQGFLKKEKIRKVWDFAYEEKQSLKKYTGTARRKQMKKSQKING